MTIVYHTTSDNTIATTLNFDPSLGGFVEESAADSGGRGPGPGPESSFDSGDQGGGGLAHLHGDSLAGDPGPSDGGGGLASDQGRADLARRYRLAALAISNPEIRRRYLDKAAALAGDLSGRGLGASLTTAESNGGSGGRGPGSGSESAADSDKKEGSSVSVPCYSPSPSHCSTGLTTEQPSGDNHSSDSIPGQVKVWSALAQVIVSGKEYTRAFVIWSVLRSMASGRGWFDVADVLDLARQAGKAQSTLYNWLDQGEGVFWNRDKGRLFLIGHYQVFDYFLGHDVRPGKLVYVPTEKLLDSKLHVVRAHLAGSWVHGDRGKIMSRETREALYSIPARTQFDYDKTANIQVKSIFVRAKPENYQISNWYGRPSQFKTRTNTRVSKRHFFGYRATDNSGTVTHFDSEIVANGSGKNGGRRRYFNDQKAAVAVAEYRKRNDIPIPVYWINPDDGRKHIKATWLC